MPKKKQQPIEPIDTFETDEAFALRFERFQLDFDTEWYRNQHSHLRTTWYYLNFHGEFSKGMQAIRYRYIRYHRHFNAGNMYHETITQFWARLVWARMEKTNVPTFDKFLERNEDLLNYGLTFEHFSGLVIANDKASKQYLAPDKKSI